MASKRLVALPRITRGALGRGWGREGGGALPLPSAAAISTRLRVLLRIERDLGREVERGEPRAWLGLGSGFGFGFGFGLGL